MNKYTQCETKEAQKLYRIGVFSQINRITVKALRYYDDIDLLKPEYVDESTGYRYYTSSQLPQLHRILALRDMDFSIDEIKQIFKGVSEEQFLKKKKAEFLLAIADMNKKVAYIEGYLAGEYLSGAYQVVMKSLPPVTIASMKVHLSSYDTLFEYMPKMGHQMELAGCTCSEPSYCFTMYFDEEYRERDIHAEICEAVTQLKEDQHDLCFKQLPAVEMAACTLHKGPYDKLPQAYSAIVTFIEESGYEIIGYQRESYIDGVWNKDCEEDWLTEIQFPVRKR